MTVVVTVTIVNGFLFNKLELFDHSQLQIFMFAHSIDIHFHAHTVIQVTLLSCVFACLTSHMHKFLPYYSNCYYHCYSHYHCHYNSNC